VFDRARGTLENNDITENKAFGVVIRDGANPVLRSNLIHGNEPGEVSVDEGLGRIEDNTISDNRGEGVLVANEATPFLQRNKIFGNERAGIYLCDRGGSTVRENKIFDNHNSGIAIRTEGNPIIQENWISGNNGKGVWCSDRAAGSWRTTTFARIISAHSGSPTTARRPTSATTSRPTLRRQAVKGAGASVERIPAPPNVTPPPISLRYPLPSRRISLSTATSVALSEAITMFGSIPTPCIARPSASWIST
jgi:parallel beta-helix repeat protein